VTVLYVTHDQEEAFGVADRVVVLREGRIEADGSPETLWSAPPTVFTARFLGFRNIVDAAVRDGVATTALGDFPAPSGVDSRASVMLPSSALRLDPVGSLAGTVIGRRFRGDHREVVIRLAAPESTELELEVRGGTAPSVGDPVRVSINPEHVVVIPDSG
jgi:thiamine transport system ATP-binding protein